MVVDAAASDSFAVLVREKETVRLGHDTLRAGLLAPEAIDRAADCIKRFASIAEARGAERVVAIATASVREARNARAFINEVRRRTGIIVEVLSGIEEARLIGVAAAQGCAPPGATLINIDIGGGSTELSLMRDGVPVRLLSLKLGAVGLSERMLTTDPVKPKELRALREQIRGALERPARELTGLNLGRSHRHVGHDPRARRDTQTQARAERRGAQKGSGRAARRGGDHAEQARTFERRTGRVNGR